MTDEEKDQRIADLEDALMKWVTGSTHSSWSIQDA